MTCREEVTESTKQDVIDGVRRALARDTVRASGWPCAADIAAHCPLASSTISDVADILADNGRLQRGKTVNFQTGAEVVTYHYRGDV